MFLFSHAWIMAVEIPEWFNADFLGGCLRNESQNKNIVVTDFKAESAIPPGNNYGSVVIRVYVNYKDEASNYSKRLIVKLPLTQGAIKEMVGDSLDLEPIFYQVYLPKAQKRLKYNFTPKYYPSSSSISVVVLEDLKGNGFVMEDKKEKLNFENCKKYAESAAMLHAGSVAVNQEDPELIKKLCSEKQFSDELKLTSTTKNVIRYGLECMADHVLKTTGNERISSIIKRCSTDLWDFLKDAVKPSDVFNTLNQGDPWITNMMFKYDKEGNCIDIKILDFQVSRYASPASDLTTFIWTSPKHYVREEKLDLLVQTYVESLNRNLEEAGCSERISLDFFKRELLRMSPIALYVVATGLPVMELSGGPGFDVVYAKCASEDNPETNPFEVYFTEDFCKNEMTPLINQMEKQGMFDYLEQCLDNK